MSGSSIGRLFRITTWGESHGNAIGAVIDGIPAGLPLCGADIQTYLDRRKPGSGEFATKRRESDTVRILSGVFENKTAGTPVSLLIENTDTRSRDYDDIKHIYRNSHADYGYDMKYGFRDYRGGGRASGRETAGRVAAGAIAAKALRELGITLFSFVSEIGPVRADPADFDTGFVNKNELCMPSENAYKKAAQYLRETEEAGDSAGGVVECRAIGVRAGIGSPVFEKLDAALGGAIFSIGAVKAVEIGAGAAVSKMKGSECNDAFYSENGCVRKRTNNAGGITGGLSDGDEIFIKAYFKPTPSIAITQDTLDDKGRDAHIAVKGRHDPVIAPRACVVVEAMTAIILFDQILTSLPSRMEDVIGIYCR